MELRSLSKIREEGKPYIEFLRTEHLSTGVYRLSKGGTDSQQPHGEQEVYFVVSGRARFLAGQSDVAVAPGDVIFVPVNEPHKFHEIDEDLELLVFFAPPEGSPK
jgi:mannose-6-phosphate isomerase-like protein (cupin superfamily)